MTPGYIQWELVRLHPGGRPSWLNDTSATAIPNTLCRPFCRLQLPTDAVKEKVYSKHTPSNCFEKLPPKFPSKKGKRSTRIHLNSILIGGLISTSSDSVFKSVSKIYRFVFLLFPLCFRGCPKKST